MTRIEFIKKVDAIAGSAAVSLLPLSKNSKITSTVRKILVVRPGGIGDAILLAPAMAALAGKFPDACITVLAEKRNYAAFTLMPEVTELLLYDSFQGFTSLLSCGFDLVVDTEQWHRLSAVMARIVCRGRLIGFATNDREKLLSDPVEYSQNDYEAESFLRLLTPLGINVDFNHDIPFLTVPEKGLLELQASNFNQTRPYVTVFPGASIAERRWGAERFRQLVMNLEMAGYAAVIVGGGGEAELASEISSGTGAVSLAGVLSLSGTAAVISSSNLLVSGDSGILHLGVGLGVGTVSLFGSGIAKKWAPRGGNHIVLNRNLPCSPCTLFGTTPPCPYNTKCMTDISVDEVFMAAMKVLAR